MYKAYYDMADGERVKLGVYKTVKEAVFNRNLFESKLNNDRFTEKKHFKINQKLKDLALSQQASLIKYSWGV